MAKAIIQLCIQPQNQGGELELELETLGHTARLPTATADQASSHVLIPRLLKLNVATGWLLAFFGARSPSPDDVSLICTHTYTTDIAGYKLYEHISWHFPKESAKMVASSVPMRSV